jgi:hypothetical protein
VSASAPGNRHPYFTNAIATKKINWSRLAFRQRRCANDPHLIRLIRASKSRYLLFMTNTAVPMEIKQARRFDRQSLFSAPALRRRFVRLA